MAFIFNRTVWKSISVIAGIFYPFGLFFYKEHIVYIALAMCVIWAIRGVCESEVFNKFVAFLLGILFLIIGLFRAEFIAYLYPLIISALFFSVFFMSLKDEPIITKFARLVHKNLSEEALNYTRNVTKIWCYFFVFNGLVSAGMALLEDKRLWLLYCGVISYILIGGLFVGEIIYRKIFKGVKNV